MIEVQKNTESPNRNNEVLIDFESAFLSEEVKYSDYRIEDFFTFIIFWALIVVVFIQFFTRYVIGNSTTWTEEIARYLLIMIAFLGSVMAVRKGSHIMVEFFYTYLPQKTVHIIKYVIEVMNIAFYAMLAWITWQLAKRTMGMMVSIDVPKKVIYYFVFAAFILMIFRAVQNLLKNILSYRV